MFLGFSLRQKQFDDCQTSAQVRADGGAVAGEDESQEVGNAEVARAAQDSPFDDRAGHVSFQSARVEVAFGVIEEEDRFAGESGGADFLIEFLVVFRHGG